MGSAHTPYFSDSVVQVRAVSSDGTVKVGSGVVAAAGQVATACHVTRGASRIEIIHGNERRVADAQIGSQHHDLCVLSAPGIDVYVARVRRSEDLRPGEIVIAVGFQGGKELVIHRGRVVALYPYDGGNVIRTTASFDFGSSGGALFDDTGNLVGLLSFKARAGEYLRFALPSEWMMAASNVARTFRPIQPTSMDCAFWERSTADRPAFLGVALQDPSSGVSAHATSTFVEVE
ncbi:MAG: S1 family peptidase [Thermoanaerobaculia bacterium]